MSPLMARRWALAEAWRRLRRRPLTSLAALLLGSLAIALPLALATLLLPMKPHWDRLDAPAQALAFLAHGAGATDAKTLTERISGLPGVREVSHVPREAALDALARRLPGLGLSDVKANPLPDVLMVGFHRTTAPDAVRTAVAEIGKLPRVDSVQFDADAHARWLAIRSALIASATGFGVALALLLAATVVVAPRVLASASTDEQRVLRLVGATHSAVRRPATYAGALLGLASAAMALGLTAGLAAGLQRLALPVMAELRAVAGSDLGALLPWPWLLAIAVLASLLGYAGGWLSDRGPEARRAPF